MANQIKYVILNHFYLKLFNFVKFWKCAKQYYEILKFKNKMYTVQENMRLLIKPQLKVKKEDGHEAP